MRALKSLSESAPFQTRTKSFTIRRPYKPASDFSPGNIRHYLLPV